MVSSESALYQDGNYRFCVLRKHFPPHSRWFLHLQVMGVFVRLWSELIARELFYARNIYETLFHVWMISDIHSHLLRSLQLGIWTVQFNSYIRNTCHYKQGNVFHIQESKLIVCTFVADWVTWEWRELYIELIYKMEEWTNCWSQFNYELKHWSQCYNACWIFILMILH